MLNASALGANPTINTWITIRFSKYSSWPHELRYVVTTRTPIPKRGPLTLNASPAVNASPAEIAPTNTPIHSHDGSGRSSHDRTATGSNRLVVRSVSPQNAGH